MKTVLRFVFIVVVIFSLVSLLSACSKSSYPARASKRARINYTANNPITPKKEPLRKKYVVPRKRRKVLGTSYR